MKVVAFAGGVGGAKLADGLAQVVAPGDLTLIVNTGDDFEHWGLRISPDLDTVCYTLAGLASPETGWGRADETWNTFDSLTRLGGADWFRLGDKDLATHIERTRRLKNGEPLSAITAAFCQAWGIACRVLPMSDERVSTIVHTDEGDLDFQEYFVHRRCSPRVSGFEFSGAYSARPAPGVLAALTEADAVIFCPSNPWVSIDPILALLPKNWQTQNRAAPPVTIAVSPIIGGQALKGPAAKMFTELGIQPSASAVARHYQGALSGFVLDEKDRWMKDEIASLGLHPLVVPTIMNSRADRVRLALDVLHFSQRLAA